MNEQLAFKLGRAFKLGMMYGLGELTQQTLVMLRMPQSG